MRRAAPLLGPSLRPLLGPVLGPVLVLGLAAAAGVTQRGGGGASGLADAAAGFLAVLEEDERARAARPFDDPARTEWHPTPGERRGVMLGELDSEERLAFDALLDATLSHEGYLTVHGVVLLERVLGRDAGAYAIAVFGEPGPTGAWGWRIEGHHLSLHVTVLDGTVVGWTPLFLGAEPAVVEEGPHAGLRVLGGTVDRARAALAELRGEARAFAHRAEEPPDEVVLVPGVDAFDPAWEGLGVWDMPRGASLAVRRLLGQLPEVLDEDLFPVAFGRMREGQEDAKLLWIGATEPGEPFYARVQTPTLVFEAVAKDGGDHLHVLWRDPPRDHGRHALGADAEPSGDGAAAEAGQGDDGR